MTGIEFQRITIERSRLRAELDRLHLEREKLRLEDQRTYLEQWNMDVEPLQRGSIEASKAAVTVSQNVLRGYFCSTAVPSLHSPPLWQVCLVAEHHNLQVSLVPRLGSLRLDWSRAPLATCSHSLPSSASPKQ